VLDRAKKCRALDCTATEICLTAVSKPNADIIIYNEQHIRQSEVLREALIKCPLFWHMHNKQLSAWNNGALKQSTGSSSNAAARLTGVRSYVSCC
jgi:hypothetical protein